LILVRDGVKITCSMRGWSSPALVVGALVLTAFCGRAAAAPGLIVGVADDNLKWASTPNEIVTAHRDLGVSAVRVTLQWTPGLTKVDQDQLIYVARAQQTAKLGHRVVLAVYGPAATPPATPDARREFCSFVVDALTRASWVYDVVIWNEANSGYFWRPQRGAGAGYEALLADCYDAIHNARRNVNVISSTSPHENPAPFIRDLGAAYRASGRAAPIFDTFGHNVYPETSNEPVYAQHPSSASLDQGDYPRLMQSLTDAFGGTGQPVPGSGRATDGSVPATGMPASVLQSQQPQIVCSRRRPAPVVVLPGGPVTIWYLEDGFETIVPAAKRDHYTGKEPNTLLVPALLYRKVASATAHDQSSQLREALLLAYCQPAVAAFFNFQFTDERDLAGWQSGLLWADGARKPSYSIVKQAVAAVGAGDVDCAQFPAAATGR
jgi:hypothetical protein